MKIRDGRTSEVTVLSNRFIDEAMGRANGEYVKIYLVLLRLAQTAGEEISVGRLAEMLENTEKDVTRALGYWEKEGWLSLTRAEDGSFTELSMTEPGQAAPEPVRTPEETAPAAQRGGYRPMTAETMAELRRDEDFSQFTFVAETYLGRTLTPKDIQLFAYLYEDLHFPAELLEYLVEYCVGGGHKSCRYMESVALGWHQEGKMTVEAAKESQKAYSRENKQIMKAFGIANRVLNEEERGYAEKWIRQMGMPLEVVIEACNATMGAIQKPSFQYTDTILADWHAAGVRTKEEAQARRDNRRQVRRENGEKAAAGGTNRFRNYQQRNIDYDALLNQGGINPYGGNA